MIETKRLILRPHVLGDLDSLYAMVANADYMKYIGGGVPATYEEAWQRLQRFSGHWALYPYGLFAIIEKTSGAYIGHTGLAHFHRGLGEDFDPFAEAAWGLAMEHHGKGYITEAARGAHDWFQAHFGPKRTVCIIDAENAPSLKVAERLGYNAYGETIYKDKRVIKFERNV